MKKIVDRASTRTADHRTILGQREREDAIFSGVLIALGIVFNCDPDPTATLAQEIVGTVGSANLLRVAKQEDDCYLPQLRATVRSLRPARSRRQAGKSNAAELFAEGQKILKGGR